MSKHPDAPGTRSGAVKLKDPVALVVVVFLWVTVGLLAVSSLFQRLHHDAALFYYLAFLMDRLHLVPYRDFLDVNLPGTYAINIAAARVFGFSNLGFRCADLLYLGGAMAVAYALLRRHGRTVAAAAPALFGMYYLGLGSYNAFQREFLLMLPVGLAVWVAAAVEWRRWYLRSALVGVLFGCAVTLKPQAAIGLPIALVYLMLQPRLLPGARPRRGGESPLAMAAVALAGFLLPLSAVALYLWHSGAWEAFVDSVVHMWPLYAELSVAPRQVPVAGAAHTRCVLAHLAMLGGYPVLVGPAVFGGWLAAHQAGANKPRRYSVYFLAALAVAYCLYPATSQFWEYHWIPALFFLSALSALCLTRLPESLSRLARLAPVLLLVVAVASTWRPPSGMIWGLGGGQLQPASADRADAMADYLRTHLRPGDTVQPLDWTGGAIAAMLQARAHPATRFLCDTTFSHHVSHPYIRALRASFMEEMASSRPRFVLEVLGSHKPMVSGPDVSYDFPELRAFLTRNYHSVMARPDCIIHERNDMAGVGPPATGGTEP